MAQFRIFPSSESRHSFVANYTSAVKFKIHIFGFVLLYNYPSVCEWKQIAISYLLGENNYNFPSWPILWRYIFTRVSTCSLHISEKCFRLKCIIIKLSVSACFPTFIKTHPRKRTDLLFCFWFFDSRVIIVTNLPSFESADSEFYFTSHNSNVHALSCLYNIEVKIMWKISRTPYALFLSLSLSLSLSLQTRIQKVLTLTSFFFIFHAVKLMRGERIQIPQKRAVIGPPAKLHLMTLAALANISVKIVCILGV